MATQEEFEKMSDSEKKKEDWMNSKWRPMMGWMYMLTCITDFVVFPILWSLLQAVMKTGAITQWMPLTLQGAGLFHIAMGAVLGLAAYGRTQEKIAGANNGGAATLAPSFTPAPTASFTPAPTASFTAAPSVPSVNKSTPFVTTSSTGKAMPAPQIDEPI